MNAGKKFFSIGWRLPLFLWKKERGLTLKLLTNVKNALIKYSLCSKKKSHFLVQFIKNYVIKKGVRLCYPGIEPIIALSARK